MDTIYALSSGSLPAGVAVVRVSGPGARDIVEVLAGPVPEPRRCNLRLLRRPSDGSLIDRAILAWFPGPNSFTGEDVAEFHLHGGRAVVNALFDVLAGLGGRLAAAGEFTRRAFAAGKLDLTEVEGLADLIAADSEAQLRQAIGAACGSLSKLAENWREEILGLRAEIEAQLDFSDEGDVPEELSEAFWISLTELRRSMREALSTARSGERVRDGFRVAILGRPNAGKSTLLNALASREVAIVTPEPGTTRDVLEVPLDLGGYPVLLYDTAGLRDAESAAEQEGVRRAELAAERADLVLWLYDEPGQSAPSASTVAPVWLVRTKADLLPHGESGSPSISARTGEGIPELMERLRLAAAAAMGREPALITRMRQRDAICQAVDNMDQVEAKPLEVAAYLLRSAGDAIGRLTGRIDVEDVLDKLFAEFCIGK